MTAKYKNDRFDDENAPNKVNIEDMYYKEASQSIKLINDHALQVSGPAYKRHAKNMLTNIIIAGIAKKAEYHIAEIREDICSIIKNAMSECPFTKDYAGTTHYRKKKGYPKIHDDVMKIEESFRFEDLDLTATWNKTIDIFKYRLEKQARSFKDNLWKCMIITVSERNGKGPNSSFNRLNELLGILGAKIKGFNGSKEGFNNPNRLCNSCERSKSKKARIYAQIPDWISQGRIKIFKAHKYSDSGNPMFTCMFLYK